MINDRREGQEMEEDWWMSLAKASAGPCTLPACKCGGALTVPPALSKTAATCPASP